MYYVPAHEEFVIPFGIRSALGMGGILPSGNRLIASIMLEWSTHHLILENSVTTERTMNQEASQLRAQVAALEELLAVREQTVLEQSDRLEQEIAERKRAENALQKYRQQFEELVEVRKAELQQTQHFLRTIINSIPVPIFYKDTNGAYLGFNQAFLDYLGKSETELLGKTVYDLNTDQTLAEKYHQADLVLFRNPGVQTYEASVKYADGSIHEVIFNKSTFDHADGSLGGLVGTMVDITERKRAEEALQESQRLYQSSVDGLPQNVYRIDRQGRITFGNKTYQETVGLTLEELLGKTAYELFPKNLADKYTQNDQLVMETGETLDTIEIYTSPTTGEESYMRVLKISVQDSDGNIIGLQGVFWDVSQHIQAEQILAKRAAELEIVAQVSTATSTILNVDRLLQEVVDLTKYRFELYHVHVYLLDDSRKRLVVAGGAGTAGATMKANQHSIPLNATTSLVARAARSGEVVWVDNVREAADWLPNELLPDTYAEMAVPIISKGQVVGVLDVQQNKVAGFDEGDASLLRSLANHIGVAIHNARLYEELAQLNADKDRFFSIVAHDLKGPFQPVLGNAEFLIEMGDALLGEEIKKIGGDIHRSGRRVLDLLESLLQWARLQMGRMEFQPQPLNLGPVAEETVDLLYDIAQAKQIVLNNRITDEMTVYADQNMVNTVIRNLTNNALKFTPTGGAVTISAEAGDEFVTVSIEDTGVGMSDDAQAKLFQMGVHHSTTGTANETGTGLGLLMCQEMVHLNGGRIWVESEVGKGSIFRFTLPVDAEAAPAR